MPRYQAKVFLDRRGAMHRVAVDDEASGKLIDSVREPEEERVSS
jgi:hypothetical protein